MSTVDPDGGSTGRRAGLGTVSTMVALGSAQGATALAMLLLARRTDTAAFGAFVSLYAITTALGALIDFGSSQHHTRELAQGAGRQIHRAWLDRRTLMQAPVGVTTALLAWPLYDDHLPPLAIIGISMQSVAFSRSLGESAAVRALRSPALAEWLVAAGNASMLVAVVLAPADSLLVVAGLFSSISWLVTATSAARVTRGPLQTPRRRRPPASRRLSNPWHGSAGFGVAAASIAGQGLMMPLLGWRAGVTAAAEVGAVGKWAQPIMLFAAAYATYTFPQLAAASDDRTALRQMKQLVVVVATGSLLALSLFFAADPLVDALLPAAYADSAGVLRWYTLAAIPVLVGQPFMALLQARGHDDFVAVASAVMNVAGLAAVGAIAARLGAPTVPVVTLVVSGTLAAAMVGRSLGFRHARLDDSQFAGHPSLGRLAQLSAEGATTSRRASATGRASRRPREQSTSPAEPRRRPAVASFDVSAMAAFELVDAPMARRRADLDRTDSGGVRRPEVDPRSHGNRARRTD